MIRTVRESVRAARFRASWWLLGRLAPQPLALSGLTVHAGQAAAGPRLDTRVSGDGRLFTRARALPATVVLGIGALLGLELWAARVDYGLRVTSDTPTFLALLRQMDTHPLERVSPFLSNAGVETSHATPYMQGLAWLWRLLVASPDGHGGAFSDPVAAYRLLAAAGLMVTVVVLHACFVWVRREAGSRAAWISL